MGTLRASIALITGSTLTTCFVSVQTEQIKKLQPVRMDAFAREKCLQGTRTDILKIIADWCMTPAHDNKNVLWLHGAVGSGKSTIATTIAEQFQELGRLGAFLFFNRHEPTRCDPADVVRTLAHQLATFDSSIAAAISERIEAIPRIGEASIRLQFANLLVEPLLSFAEQHAQGPIILVFDALDECGNPRSRGELLLRLAQEFAKLPPIFRILITSRAESDIEAVFSRQPNISPFELDNKTQSTASDIVAYLRHRMAIIQKRYAMYNLDDDWPGEERIQTLAHHSAGLFVWASTAATFIEEGHNPEDQLSILLSADARSRAESALDALYATALEAAGKWDNETFASNCRAVLGVVLVARIPLSDQTIDRILDLSGYHRSQFILSRLGCLLRWHPGEPVRILHTSIADYLSDPLRCGDRPWFIDVTLHIRNLAQACFRIMKAELRFNICQLQTSYVCNDDAQDLVAQLSSAIGDHLSYSCRFWADHLQEISPDTLIVEVLNDFVDHRLLYWLEVLSLVKEVGIAPSALLSMSAWLKVCSSFIFHLLKTQIVGIQDHDSSLAAFAADASRFVTTFQRPISQSVPHIYLSALPFAPVNSKISKRYASQYPGTLCVQIGKATHWPAILNVLEGHKHSVTSVAFSPKGKLLVSGSDDHTIRVWNAATGDAVAGPFMGHTGGVKSVCFSPDGRRIASGSVDQTIRVWDAETGDSVSQPFEGHAARIVSIAFSPDGERIASGSWDRTIRVWDAFTGVCVSGSFEGHTDPIHSITFSPDGTRIASGSSDKTIRIWQAETGNPILPPLEGHANRVTSVAFSPDGRRIASGSWDETVRVWDAETGALALGPLLGHADSVLSVAFSPDGKRIVSGSGDKTIQVWGADTTDVITSSPETPINRVVSRDPHHTIRVWDAVTGQDLSGPFQGDSDWVNTVAFSPDGSLIASGSGDKTIQIWDAHAEGVAPAASEGHTRGIRTLAMSPDGNRIASGSIDQTVRIWDTETGKPLSEPFEGHTGRITSIAFSPNGNHVVSGAIDQTIRVWDAATGETVVGPIRGHSGGVRSVCFSPDGRQIASGSIDQTIRLWDAETGRPVSSPFEGHIDRVTSVAWSPDGTRIASGSWDKTVRIWDAQTGVIAVRPCEGHTHWVSWVTFSPSGEQILSAAEDHTIRLWDTEKGDQLRKFEGHGHAVNCATFSLDGSWIVSCSADKTIRVWDVATGIEVYAPFEGHTDWVNGVALSPDRKRIVSCSGDKTVQIWDAETTDDTIRETVPGGLRHESNGWILGPQSEKLFWVPPTNRIGLWQPRSIAIISHISTKLDYSRFVHGKDWQTCRG